MKNSDEYLIEAYLGGKTEDFKLLIDRYATNLYNFSIRFVGSDNVDDIVQETFIKVWKNIKKFDSSKAHFKTWLFTIARNTVTDYLRKRKLIVFSDMDSGDEEIFSDTIKDDAVLPDEALQRIQDKESLDKLLSNLSLNYKTVLILYYQEDMTFVEIGKILGKPLNTVKSQHRRALEALREMIL